MKIFGLIGESLSQSLSPIIHRKIYEHIGLDAVYNLFQVKPQQLEAACYGIKALDISGCNVTIPYKIDIIKYLNSISEEAARIGAINTVRNEDDFLKGYNTDYMGFGKMLDYFHVNYKNKPAVILGSGGVARAVATYLTYNGISDLYIVSRTAKESQTIGVSNHKLISYQYLAKHKLNGLLINCTPVGMYPNENATPITMNMVSNFDNVIDLIYNPTETLLMHYAKCLDIPSYNGLYMLVAQAVSSVEIWNDTHIENDILTNIFLELSTRINK